MDNAEYCFLLSQAAILHEQFKIVYFYRPMRYVHEQNYLKTVECTGKRRRHASRRDRLCRIGLCLLSSCHVNTTDKDTSANPQPQTANRELDCTQILSAEMLLRGLCAAVVGRDRTHLIIAN